MAKVAPHPTRSLAIGSASLGAGVIALGATVGQPIPIGFGLLLVGYGVYLGYIGPTVQVANLAGAAINRGDMDEARARITEARARRHLASITRLLDSHEAEIAWREGDLVAARRHAEDGLSRKDVVPLQRELFRSHLEGLRALACAASGDDLAAEASIAAVQSNPRATGGPLARAALAHAVLLARRSDLGALHQHLARHHVLLCETLEPRGRALFRALRRMAALRSSSVYRIPVKQESVVREGSTRSWMSRVFPQGQGLVDLDDTSPPADALATPTNAQMAPLPKPVKARAKWARVVALWVVLVALFIAVWSFFSDVPRRPGRPPSAPLDFTWVYVTLLGVFAGLLWFLLARARRKQMVLEEATRALVSGELDRAQQLVEPLRNDHNRLIAAGASACLAGVFERRAQMTEALAECERGIAHLGGISRAASADVLLPQLVAMRAHYFGALGRDLESDGELVRLAHEFPAFPYAAGWVLRTRLLRAVRRDDLVEARTLAKARGDVGVGAQVEILAEMALLEESDDREERAASIREDLALMPDLERWVRVVVPGFLERTLKG